MSLEERVAEAIREWEKVGVDAQARAALDFAEKRDLLLALGFVSCQTCHGSGHKVEYGVVDEGAGVHFGSVIRRCPDCGGLGVRPSDEANLRAAKRMTESVGPWDKQPAVFKELWLNLAGVALLAGIGLED